MFNHKIFLHQVYTHLNKITTYKHKHINQNNKIKTEPSNLWVIRWAVRRGEWLTEDNAVDDVVEAQWIAQGVTVEEVCCEVALELRLPTRWQLPLLYFCKTKTFQAPLIQTPHFFCKTTQNDAVLRWLF